MPGAPTTAGGRARVALWRTEPFWAAVLVLAVVAAYLKVWHAGFIWDDEMHLTQNPCIVGPLGLADIWTSRAARYFPLVLTTFWTEHAIWGLNPLPYHVVNVLLHAACALALWRLLRLLRVRGALLGSALWALHPVQVESVAWVTELKNTQSGLFYLLALLSFSKWASAGGTGAAGGSRPYALALLLAALAMASKSSTVVLPLVMGLCAWWITGRLTWRMAARLAPFLALSAAAGALSLWTQGLEGANAPEWQRGLPERIAIAGYDVWFYLGKLAWPHPLVFIYPRWSVDPARVGAYFPTAAMGAVLVVLWLGRAGRLRPAFLAFAYFLIALAPVLGLLDQYFWRYSFVGDHFQYLASMGPLALVGAALGSGYGKLRSSTATARALACGALLCVLGVLTWRQCAIYHDADALWRATVARNPACWMAHNNLGSSYLEAGRPQEAAGEFRQAIDARPGDVEAHYNLGVALSRMGRLDEAIAEDRKALSLDSRFERAYNALGDALLQEGRVDESVAMFRQALEIKPGYAEAETNYGNAMLRAGRTAEAVAHYRRAIGIDPENAAALSNLGSALLSAGAEREAAGDFERALAVDPRFAMALVGLGNARLQEDRPDLAAALYLRALQALPGSAEANNNLGYALMQEGKVEAAVARFRRALEINPGYGAAHQNLGKALLKLGRVNEADAQFQEAAPGR
jgi:tetratricopeptide (TPR) repeat protein